MTADALRGRLIVVTGASRGLGRTLALRFAEAGAQVALLAHASSALDKVAAEVGAQRGQPFVCDVGDPGSVRAAFASVVEHFGGIDVLVNNAAIYLLGKTEQLSDADIRAQFDVDLLGPIYCARAAIPHLRARGGGDIVNLSSESVDTPFPYLGIYAAAKAGLEAFSKALQSEVQSDRIRVSVLRAGRMTGTDGQANWSAERKRDFFKAVEQSGHAAISGNAASSTASVAGAIIALLSLPRDLRAELVAVRPF